MTCWLTRYQHALRRALEEQSAKLRFGLDDLLADSANGNAKFICSRLKRAKPTDGLQCAKAIEMHGAEISHIVFL